MNSREEFWAYHAPPRDQESLDSWLFRLAQGTRLDLVDFLEDAGGTYTHIAGLSFPLCINLNMHFLSTELAVALLQNF